MLNDEIINVELTNLKEQLYKWNKKSIEIQNKFNFILPKYIIDEIIEKEDTNDFSNLNYLINCAVVNGRLSKDNGALLKKVYIF
ncbi:MAG: hypothetical protein IJH39_09875 [Clostridia bacterium]|nr:hypothetical protein [Clostridia bacterium]